MTSVNVTTTKNTVTVSEGDTRIVTIKTQGPQGPSLPDGDKGDVTVSSNGTAISINNSAVTSAKIADGAIVNADINASAAIELSKLATGALPTAITVTSANISDLSIVNADINASAAIAGTKISPDFGSQNIVTTGTGATGALGVTGNITVSGTVDGRDVAADGTKLDGIETGATADQTKADIDSLGIAASTAATLLNARTIAGTSFDGSANIDISYTNLTNKLSVGDGGLTQNNFTNALKTKLDGIETAATADQTAAEIKTLLDSNGIVNSNVDASAAIAGTKISPSFTSNIDITNTLPKISLVDSNNNDDFDIKNQNGIFIIADATDSADRLTIASNGQFNLYGNVDISNGLDVTGNITVSGTVDGVDIAARDTLFGTLTDTADTLKSSVRCTTLASSDNSTRLASTAFVQTAIALLVDSSPSTLNTLNELAAALGDDANFSTTVTNSIATKMPLAGGQFTGNITFSGTQTVDGRDLSVDGSKLDGIESNATADQTASEIVALVADQTIAPSTIDMEDNEEIRLGTSDDLIISHDGSNSKIADGGTGNLILFSNKLQVVNSAGSESMIIANQNAAVELYYDNSKKLETTSTGVKIPLSSNQDGLEFFSSGDIFPRVIGNTNRTLGDKFLLSLEGIWNNNHTVAKISIETGNDTTNKDDGRIVFHTATSNGTVAERLRIEPSGNVQIPADNARLQIGASQDLELFHNGTNSFILSNSHPLILESDSLILRSDANEKYFEGTSNGAVELYYDNSKKFETSSTGVTVTGGLTASGASTFNEDVTFTGATSGRNAVWDTSDNALKFADHATAKFGTGDDLQIYHDNSNSYIQDSGTGSLQILTSKLIVHKATGTETMAEFTENGAVELYYDNSKKLETNSTGIHIFGNTGHADGAADLYGSGNDLSIFHNGTDSVITNTTGELILKGLATDGNTITLQPKNNESSAKFIPDGQVELYYDNSKKAETTTNGFQVSNGNLDIFNTSGGANIRNVSSSGSFFIGNPNNGDLALYVQDSTDNNIVLQINTGEKMLECTAGGSTDLYHHGSKKFETTSSGVKFTGTLEAIDNQSILLGTGNDLRIRHTGSHSEITDEGDGNLRLGSNQTEIRSADLAEVQAKFIDDGAVELYHDNSKKFYTTSTGAYIENRLDIGGANNGWSYPKPLNVQGSSGAILALRNWDTTTYAADTNTSIDFSLRTGNTGNQSGSCEIRAFKENGTNGNNARGLAFYTGANGGQPQKRLNITSDGNVQIANDSGKLQVGASQDLQIYHNGSNSYIDDQGTGSLIARSNQFLVRNIANDNNIIVATAGAAVDLYYDNSKKLETTSNGIEVTGKIELSDNLDMPDSGKIIIGTGDDIKIYHNSSNDRNKIESHNGKQLRIDNGSAETMAIFKPDEQVELFYDDVKKFETDTNGITVTGRVLASGTSNIGFAGLDNVKLSLGTSDDLQIYHDGSNSYLDNSTGDFFIRNNSNAIKIRPKNDEESIVAHENGSVELHYDNSKKFETVTGGVSVTGILTATNAANSNSVFASTNNNTRATIELNGKDSSGNQVELRLGGFGDTTRGEIFTATNHALGFATNNAAAQMTLDTSGNLNIVNDSGKVRLGASADLQIYHDGSNSYIQDLGTGQLRFLSNDYVFYNAGGNENIARFIENGAVELYYDNAKKFETTTNGNSLQGAQQDLQGDVKFDNQTNAGMDLRWDESLNRLHFEQDNIKAVFGTGSDFEIYHNGFTSIIGSASHTLAFYSDVNHSFHNANGTENLAKFIPNGAAELYYDNSKKLETNSTGIHIFGNTGHADGAADLYGSGNDLSIFHDGSDSLISNSTGVFFIQNAGDLRLRVNNTEAAVHCVANGAVELHYDNSKKFETTSTGVQVDGGLTVSSDYPTINLFDTNNNDFRIQNRNGVLSFVDVDNSDVVRFAIDSGNAKNSMAGTLAVGTLELADNAKAKFGTGDDLQIYHNGSHSIIQETGTGDLELCSNTRIMLQKDRTEALAKFIPDGAVELYYDNSKKFETSNTGATVTGFLGINVASPDSPLEVAGTGPSLATIHHSDGGTNDEARIMLGALSANPPDQRGAGISARNNGAGHNLEIQTSSSHSAGPSTKMIVTSAGLVGIGTISPSDNLDIASTVPTIRLSDTDGNTPYSRITAGGGDLVFEADQGDEEGNTLMLFRVDDSEKMRIESSGAIRSGVTSAIQAEKYSWFRQESDANTLAYFHQAASADVSGIIMRHGRGLSGFAGKIISFCRNDGTEVGSVTIGATSTGFNTTSDYRLKENVTSITDGITRLKTLKPYRFNFKDDTTKPVVDGFFAHEVTAVPEAITGTKDEVDADNNPVYQSIDQSKLVPLLVAAVQELIGRVEKLEEA